jgi:hypothetical protein
MQPATRVTEVSEWLDKRPERAFADGLVVIRG